MADVLPASFRGAPFAVRTSGGDAGRRLAKHSYPGRDGVYPEDLGRRGRGYRVQGFIVTNSVVYGGGPVDLQLQLVLAAAELAGPGLLIHPSLGALRVSCEGLSWSGDLAAGTAIDVEWTFVEYSQPLFSLLSASTVAIVTTAALLVDGAASVAFQASGVSGASGASASAQWCSAVVMGGRDATALTNLASQLQGPYGRYFAGGNAGYLTGGSASLYSGDATVSDLVASASTARAAIGSASATVATDFASFSASSSAQTANDVQALVAALMAACADPADALRILTALALAAPTGVTAVDDLFRRAAVVAATRASSLYQPSSQNDAASVQAQVTGLLDGEIEVTGDEGDDASYQVLKSLRQAVVADLQARGAGLASLKTYNLAASLPALALAERLYGDASRADQLVSEAAPIHPLFMPTTFQALVS